MQNDLGREPTDAEVAEATNIDASELRKNLEVGRAARNKLIKVLTLLYLSDLLDVHHRSLIYASSKRTLVSGFIN